jgi:predicted dehydrogenase
MTAALRVGVLSTANIARAAVVPALHACSDAEVVAVASRDAERARTFASEAGIPRAHGSYEALLDDDGVDALYVALPNALHEEWTVRALEAGKHVLCEKPLAPTAQACRRMGAAAERSGRVLMEAFMYRFHPRTRRAEAMVRDGRIGRLAHVDATFTFRVRDPSNIRLSRELAGGALLDVGCYTVDVARRLVGRPARAVSAASRFDGADGVDLETAGWIRFEGGTVATVRSALTLPRREVVHASGEEGGLRLVRAFLPGDGPVTIEVADARGMSEAVEIPGKDPYLAMVETFADRAQGRAGDDMPASDAAEAASTVAILEALAASARAGGAPVQPGEDGP